MQFFGFNIGRRSKPVTKSAESNLDNWLRGEESGRGGVSLSNAYEQVVWVYRAINVLAEQIGNIPFLFSSGERGRENLITSGPLIDFYNQPHPQINRFQYWELRLIWLMLRGECFRIPIYSDLIPRHPTLGTHHLQRVLMPDPAHFRHIIHNHELIGWRYTGFGPNAPLASQVFLPEEVWFEKLPNPFNFWRGLAPLEVAGLAAQTDFAAGAFMKGVMENNGDLGLVVRMEDQAGPEQREQLKAALRDRKRRAGTADSPLLLWNTAEIVQPRLSSSDLQFLENRKFSRAEICAAFGVPEEIVTTTDNSKYDVVSGARLNFIEHRVAPLCRRLEAGEEATVKSLQPGAVGWFDLDSLPIMQKAQRDRLAAARSVFDMGVPFNELNRVLDLGFRRLPWGDRGYVASKLTEVGQDSPKGSRRREEADFSPGAHVSPPPHVGGYEAQPLREQTEPLKRMDALFGEMQKQLSDHENLLSRGGLPVPIRCARIDTESKPASGLDVDRQLSSRLRRFFFEQRGRVLANLTKSTMLSPSDRSKSIFFDVVAEAKEIETLKLPTSIGLEQADQLREWLSQKVHEIGQSITASLAVGIGETREQLAERVRAIYNGISIPVGKERFGADCTSAAT